MQHLNVQQFKEKKEGKNQFLFRQVFLTTLKSPKQPLEKLIKLLGLWKSHLEIHDEK